MQDQMSRVVIIGVSGAGKTTLADDLAQIWGHERVEMDALNWEANWTEVDKEVLRERVDRHTTPPRWVLDGNYGSVRDIVWPRADTIIWLNYSFPCVLSRIIRRTIRRGVRREVLWGGNQESLVRSFFSKESIIWWTISTYKRRRKTYPALFQMPEHEHLQVIEFTHPQQTQGWLKVLRSKRSSVGVVVPVEDEHGADGAI